MSGKLYSQDNSFFMQKLTRRGNDAEEEELLQKYGPVVADRAGKKGKKQGNKAAGAYFGSQEENYGTGSEMQRKKKGAKFVNVYEETGKEKVIKLPGRHPCECQARRHKLINNCLECGKIVCDQEGSGPCFFCGNLVCSNEEMEIIARDSKKGRELRTQLMAVSGTSSDRTDDSGPLSLSKIGLDLDKAVGDRDRLLAYDRDKARRTRVIDDQSDYFQDSTNPWISKNERDLLAEKQKAMAEALEQSRLDRKATFTLDFMGRQVLEEKPDWLKMKYEESEEAQGSQSRPSAGGNVFSNMGFTNDENNEFPIPDNAPMKLEYDFKLSTMKKAVKQPSIPQKSSGVIQDAHLKELSDQGHCISVRQPFASFLVLGIKRHEGRSWYCNHRGPLWIAASSKAPNPEEIKTVEGFYKRLYDGKLPAPFPSSYPAGCVLGRVSVKECLPEEEYHEQFPHGECDDPYVLICENPKEIGVKFPIRGAPGIFQLDSTILKAVKKMV